MAFKGLKECLLNSRHIYPFYSWVKELVFLASPGVTFVTHQSCADSYVFSLPKYPFLTFSPDQSACPYFKWQSGLNLLQEPTGLCAVASGVWVSVPGGEEVEQASCLNAIVLAGSGNASGHYCQPLSLKVFCAWATRDVGKDWTKFTRFLTPQWFQCAIRNLERSHSWATVPRHKAR